MKFLVFILFAAFSSSAMAAQPGLGFGDNPRLDELFATMQSAEGEGAESAEREVLRIFRQSGSPAMDLLYQRGVRSIEQADYPTAIWHFSALIDHAPGFAEAYNGRATAFYLLGIYGESISDIERTLALNPRQFGALMGLGAIYEGTDNLEAAYRSYKAAQALSPHSETISELVKRVEEQLFLVH